MSRNSLDLQGDEYLEEAIEAAFDVRFTDGELMGMVTVGAIHDVIDARLPIRAGACETSMTFYRLRRALVGMGITERISPETRLPSAFSDHTHTQFRALSKASSLALPPIHAGPLTMGCLFLFVTAILSLVAGQVFKEALLGWLALGGVVAGIILAKLDPGRLPDSLSTVGALARRTAPLNFGRLNAALTWRVLLEVISDVAEIEPEEIGRETLIYTPKKAVA